MALEQSRPLLQLANSQCLRNILGIEFGEQAVPLGVGYELGEQGAWRGIALGHFFDHFLLFLYGIL